VEVDLLSKVGDWAPYNHRELLDVVLNLGERKRGFRIRKRETQLLRMRNGLL
jgi:hypothetical protein